MEKCVCVDSIKFKISDWYTETKTHAFSSEQSLKIFYKYIIKIKQNDCKSIRKQKKKNLRGMFSQISGCEYMHWWAALTCDVILGRPFPWPMQTRLEHRHVRSRNDVETVASEVPNTLVVRDSFWLNWNEMGVSSEYVTRKMLCYHFLTNVWKSRLKPASVGRLGGSDSSTRVSTSKSVLHSLYGNEPVASSTRVMPSDQTSARISYFMLLGSIRSGYLQMELNKARW